MPTQQIYPHELNKIYPFSSVFNYMHKHVILNFFWLKSKILLPEKYFYFNFKHTMSERKEICHLPCKSVSDLAVLEGVSEGHTTLVHFYPPLILKLQSMFDHLALQRLSSSTSFSIYLWRYCSQFVLYPVSCWYCLMLWSPWQEFPAVSCSQYGKVMYFICFELDLY